jgi:hypothetical protein
MSERVLGNLNEARQQFESGLALFRRMRNKAMEASMLSELGHIARLTGDEAGALEMYRKTILLWWDLGGRAAVANQLECFAFLAVRRNQPSRAARLLGAAEALRETVDSPMTDIEQAEYAEETRVLRSLLPERELANCWAEGRSMTIDQAVLLAREI